MNHMTTNIYHRHNADCYIVCYLCSIFILHHISWLLCGLFMGWGHQDFLCALKCAAEEEELCIQTYGRMQIKGWALYCLRGGGNPLSLLPSISPFLSPSFLNPPSPFYLSSLPFVSLDHAAPFWELLAPSFETHPKFFAPPFDPKIKNTQKPIKTFNFSTLKKIG